MARGWRPSFGDTIRYVRACVHACIELGFCSGQGGQGRHHGARARQLERRRRVAYFFVFETDFQNWIMKSGEK